MGFSIPKLELPKLPELDINSEIGKLTATFNPSDMVGAVEGNVHSQLAQLESMRSQLETLRDQAQKAAAEVDFNALSSYTASLQQMTDVSCIMSSAKPAFTPMTPDSLSNPLADSGNLGGLASEALGAYLGVDPAIVDAAMSGDVETLTSPDTLTDLAIAGAGAYVSGLTGGVVPPNVASSVIESVAGDTINSTISGAMSGDIPTVASLDVSKNISGTDAFSTAIDAIGADATGGLLGGALTQSTSGVLNAISDDALSSLDYQDLANIANSSIHSLGAADYGTDVGGYNLSDPSSLISAEAITALDRGVESGNISAASSMLGILEDAGHSVSMFSDQVKHLGDNLVSNPATARLYTELYDKYVPTDIERTVVDTTDAVGDIIETSVKVFNAVAQTPETYDTRLAEKVHGKDEARKRKALLTIAGPKRTPINKYLAGVPKR